MGGGSRGDNPRGMRQGNWQGGGCGVVAVAMKVAVGVVWRTTDAKRAVFGTRLVRCRAASTVSFSFSLPFWSLRFDTSIPRVIALLVHHDCASTPWTVLPR